MKLTPQGEVLYATARNVIHAAREAEAAVQRLDGIPRGLLRVSIPTGMPEARFATWLAEFLHAYPEVSLEVVASAVHVDLVADGFDLALRAGEIEDPSLVVRVLANDTRVAVASQDYLARRGVPSNPDALSGHNCLVGYKAGSTPELRWPLRDGGWVPVSGTLVTNQMGLRLESAKRNLGIALVVDRLAAGHVAKGELVVVLPGVLGRSERLSMVYPDRTFLHAKVRAFVDFIAARIHEVRAE